MDSADPEKRIAELERQLAQQKRIAELERQLTEAKAVAGGEGVVGQGVDEHTLRDATIRVGHSAVNPSRQDSRQRSQRKRAGSNLGTIIGIVGGGFGICIGGAAALVAVFPSSALWTSAIVCSSPYQLAYGTSHYSYKPGQSGRIVSFQCVNGANAYAANHLAIGGLQALAIALVACGILVAVKLFRRGLRKPG